MTKRTTAIAPVVAGEVYRVDRFNPPRFVRVVDVDNDRALARVTTCNADGSPIDGRKPYGVTTRRFSHRYTKVSP